MSDQIASEQAVPWVAPVLVPGNDGRVPESKSTDDSLPETVSDRIENAREEAYLRGYQDGQQENERHAALEREQFRAIIASMKRPLESLENDVMQELLSFGRAIAKLMLKRELASDGEFYSNLIIKLSETYANGISQASITMHPADVALVQSCDLIDSGSVLPRLVGDVNMPRGSCLLDAGDFFADAGVDAFVEQVAETVKNTIDTHKPK